MTRLNITTYFLFLPKACDNQILSFYPSPLDLELGCLPNHKLDISF